MVLRAAIYARKSTEQNVAEDAKSVTLQVELARAFVTKQGWSVAEGHVYVDDGISGADFVNRQGLTTLLADAKSKPRPFDVLVTMSVDRMGREQFAVATTLLQIVEASVRVFFYSTGQELTLDTPINKFMLSAQGFAAEDYRHQIRIKTRDRLRNKAENGYVAGGKVLGYNNVRVGSHVTREIDPEQADIVRRIFQLCAEGKGLKRIAKALNGEGVENPTGQARGTKDDTKAKKAARLWSATGIRDVLHRELYRGVVVYGKKQSTERGGRPVRVDAPESSWLRIEKPELRIVSEELWQAAHARLAQTRAAHLQRTDGKLNGKPESGLEGRYLLSGFLRCDECGGSMIAVKRINGRGVGTLGYICNTHRTRGDAACAVKQPVPLKRVHDTMVWMFSRHVLTPALLETVVSNLIAEATKPEAPGAREELQGELRRVEGELTRLADAVAAGAVVETLLAAIKTREQEKRDLVAKLAQLDNLPQAADRESIEAKIKDKAKDWQGALTLSPAAGRQVLRRVLTSPIFIRQTGERSWKFRYTGTLGKLFSGGFAEWRLPPEESLIIEDVPNDEVTEYQDVAECNGGCEPSGTRTRDSLLKRQVLYHLS